MRHYLRRFITLERAICLLTVLFCVLLITSLLGAEAICPIFTDPCVPDGEQIIWRAINEGETHITTVTWRVKNREGRPVYEITTDTGERKQAKYIIDKHDLRLIWCNIVRNTKDGRSESTIDVKDGHQYLSYDFKNERKDKKIEDYPDGYNGMILGFCLRGFPFGKRKLDLRITPPFRPGMPLWAWKMWKGYARFLGEEEITVPAGKWNCYKLEVAASSGIIKMFTTKYYFWFAKEPPYRFVKYEAADGKSMTELVELINLGEKESD